MVAVVRYTLAHKDAWDAFVAASKNGTFLLLRDYMEYHADRFTDHSLLFYRKGQLLALLPANEAGQEIHSHGGLTYGGIISGGRMKTGAMLEVFEAMTQYFRKEGFRKILYKTIPHIYHQFPAEEDVYALFRFGATLFRRDASSVVALARLLGYSRKRRWEVKKARESELQVLASEDYGGFMQLERDLLQTRYNLSPVHTAAEMALLASRFPQNIKLYIACAGNEMVGGILVYETATVAHCQYIGYTVAGRGMGAVDVLINHLLTEVYPHKKYFNFGISTERQGQYLNEGLIRNKESYGARTMVHDFYELAL
ncbi:GNAT family N-acetyltransferase [Pontibacter sp. E15-1]|uniref:GNAT family N-acetyltransferase n=1 Tax=Pontibacter sp. E15-1 TaxID=2919918 RepID=UPI001F4F1FCE|nr:GNAT family N-acetyltransferase [Pontibacter sp. E15-1]MCJ8166856.1 GNAT family N-acetyltransferase [Pontibacter sp. E15-1]